MEAVDVADGVVDVGIEGHGVGAAIGQGEESITASISDGRAETAKVVGCDSVLEGVVEVGKIGVGAGTGLREIADGQETDLSEGAGAAKNERAKVIDKIRTTDCLMLELLLEIDWSGHNLGAKEWGQVTDCEN